jgi:ribulose-phosphate 3-epimerase
MAEIIPAIIPKSIEDLREKISLVEPFVSLVQIDVTDGKYVKSRNWPYFADGLDPTFEEIKEEKEGLPFWDKIDYEVDLMVKDPEEIVDDWIRIGVKRVVIHWESSKDPVKLLRRLAKDYATEKNFLLGLEVGVAINLKTPIEELFSVLEETDIEGRPIADFVQFMGIKEIGFQKQTLDVRVLDKISDLREKYPSTIISIDGGITTDNADDLVAVGVNRLVSGSAIFENENPGHVIKYFSKL